MIQAFLNLFKRTPATPNWKKPIQIHYTDKGNILTVMTLDHNIKEYYHTINDHEWHETPWRNHPSRTAVKDKELIKRLNSYYPLVLQGKKIRGGWVKELR